jgi:hypothetical protein
MRDTSLELLRTVTNRTGQIKSKAGIRGQINPRRQILLAVVPAANRQPAPAIRNKSPVGGRQNSGAPPDFREFCPLSRHAQQVICSIDCFGVKVGSNFPVVID